jgi:hypothetical protein
MSMVVFGWVCSAVESAGASALAKPVDMILWALFYLF